MHARDLLHWAHPASGAWHPGQRQTHVCPMPAGGKKHVGADAKTTEYSMVGCLDPSFAIPPDTYRAYRAYRADSYRSSIFDPPTSPEEKDTKFPAAHAISKGNAVVMAMCMKLAYEDWPIVRDIVDNLWNRHGEPRLSFTAGFTFDYASPVGELQT